MTPKKVPMVDLYAQYLTIRSDVNGAVNEVIRQSAFVGGSFVERFEAELAKYCKTDYAVGLNSGTDALFLSLWALGIRSGDEVITTPFTFFATAEAIIRLGAKPVFVDIDPDSFNIDPALLKSAITKRTKAIIPVHLFGRPADMGVIKKLAVKNGLFVIEDACQAIGAAVGSRKAGSLSDVGCFSFFPSKNLGAYGDGGAIVTNSKELADSVRKLRNHGSVIKYYNDSIGVSSRLDGLQAAILLAKLPHLDRWNQARRTIAEEYTRLLNGVDGISTPPEDNNDIYSVYHQYTIRVLGGKRDNLKAYLAENGVSSAIYYPIPLHLLPAMAGLRYKKGSLPVVEMAGDEVLSLPIYPELSFAKVAKIARLVKNYVQK
jgi:dTDP-4-amino-4,6-dideoxygalactose transaminase